MSELNASDVVAADELELFIQKLADECCQRQHDGIAIGIIVNGKEHFAVSGFADSITKLPISPSTPFEIGSLTKLFTSLLLAIAVRKNETQLDAPVQIAFADEVKIPTDGQSQITFRSLANHRSSLPRLPNNLMRSADMTNPYVHYDQSMLYACLSDMKALPKIGSQEEYSNFGVGLLGHALGRLAGSDYRTILRERVLNPLEMTETTAGEQIDPPKTIATSHSKKNKPTKHWDFSEPMIGAGGIRASLADMMKFLRANVDPKSCTLCDALMMMREPSPLPFCEKRTGAPPLLGMSLFVICSFALLIAGVLVTPHILSGLVRGNTNHSTNGFWAYAIIMATTMGTAIYWKYLAGISVLLLSSVLTWQFWIPDLAWFTMSIFGIILVYIGANMGASQVSGGGRLAWQSSPFGKHQMLWHNGMVGGAASFLGIIEPIGIGVVVLTNTARQVDAVGVRLLSELVRQTASERS